MHVSRITFYDLHRQTGGTKYRVVVLRGLPFDHLRVLSLCSTCQDLSFPTLTQEVWVPGTTHGGQHKSRNYLLWSPACLPLRCMCEICSSGMCRALAEGKVAQSHCLPGKRWQIHDRLSRSRCTRGNKPCGTGYVWHYMVSQVVRRRKESAVEHTSPWLLLIQRQWALFSWCFFMFSYQYWHEDSL